MTKKIIFWIDASIIHFGIAKYLQDNFECDLFAIIDITNKPKKFFQTQQIVNFQKSWYYHDHFQNLGKPDIEYISSFEKKYNLNLWEMLNNDRIFFQYNPNNYTFDENEVLSIQEKECKLFESILDEVKPDFLLIHETALRHQHLFHEMCKIKGITILMLNFANFGQRAYISEEFHKLDYLDNLAHLKHKSRNFNDLQNLLKSAQTSKHIMNFYKKYRNSKIDKLKAALYFLLKSESNTKTHYSYYGRTKLGVLKQEIISSIKSIYRESFVNKNFSFDIVQEPFVFFPLHQEPERSLLISSPFINNQIEVIKLISKSLPVGYKLYVKEHPTQGKGRGWRPISIYKKMQEIPNVKLIHPSVDSEKIFPLCSLVISISGTSCFEAAFYQKPAIVFANEGYTILPSIYRVKSPEDLHKMINSALETPVNVTDVDKYVTFLEENSFIFNYPDLVGSYHNWFYFGGNLVDVEIPIEKMESFLIEKKSVFKQLAFEHIKKINQHDGHH